MVFSSGLPYPRKFMKRITIYCFLLACALSFAGCPAANKSPKKKIPRLFVLSEVLDTDKEPSFLVTEDFNNDGNLDLIVLNSGAHNLSYFKGKGDATFSDPILIKTGADPICVAVADFNQDDLLDLAVVNYQDQNIYILLNSGGGSFRNTGTFLKPGKIPINLTADDFNGDGFPDLMVSMRYHKVMYLENIGKGNFKDPVSFPVKGQPTGLVTEDYNHDGFRDVAVALAGSGRVGVQILWGKGKGEFKSGELYRAGKQPLTIVNIDANGDGYMDLVTSSNSLHALTAVMNNGDGTFKSHKDFSAGEFPKFVVADDFTGDGFPDLAVSNATNDTISVAVGRGDGTFTYPPVLHFVEEYPQGMAVGDYNNDGRIDIAVACRDKNFINILLKKNIPVSRTRPVEKTIS